MVCRCSTLSSADGTSDLVKNLFRFQRRPVTHDPRGRPAAAAAPPLHTVPGGYAYRRRTAAVHSRQLSANWPCLVRFSVTVPPSREPCGSSQARAVSLDDLSSASPACGHREPVKADMVSTGTSVGPVSRPGRSARVMLCPPPPDGRRCRRPRWGGVKPTNLAKVGLTLSDS